MHNISHSPSALIISPWESNLSTIPTYNNRTHFEICNRRNCPAQCVFLLKLEIHY